MFNVGQHQCSIIIRVISIIGIDRLSVFKPSLTAVNPQSAICWWRSGDRIFGSNLGCQRGSGDVKDFDILLKRLYCEKFSSVNKLTRLVVIIPRKSLYDGVDAMEESNSSKLVEVEVEVTGVDVDGGEGGRGRGGGGGDGRGD